VDVTPSKPMMTMMVVQEEIVGRRSLGVEIIVNSNQGGSLLVLLCTIHRKGMRNVASVPSFKHKVTQPTVYVYLFPKCIDIIQMLIRGMKKKEEKNHSSFSSLSACILLLCTAQQRSRDIRKIVVILLLLIFIL
jgi:hypothetical protein